MDNGFRMNARILIVEDEEPLTMLLRYNLEAEGYEVETSARGDEADTRLKESTPDLVVLDWMLPGLSGIELCRRLRARPETRQLPIIMLTARGEESEKVRGLATGADDYIVKPFSVPELLARVRALLRRANPERVATILSIGDIELDREKKRVSRNGRPVDLGPTEYRLLEFLMERPGRVFSREQLLDGVWGSDIYIDERTVDVHVGRLRKAINRGHMSDPDPDRARGRLCARRSLRPDELSGAIAPRRLQSASNAHLVIPFCRPPFCYVLSRDWQGCRQQGVVACAGWLSASLRLGLLHARCSKRKTVYSDR
jgi:two-component system phosphate regulon response regulator PhoB